MSNDSPRPQRPTSVTTRDSWRAYWTAIGMPWRTEPEIGDARQHFLSVRRAIQPDIARGIYSFKDTQLERADVEWLLATHEAGRGPIDWNDQHIWKREGVDLRGADLRRLDLTFLPLARVRCSLSKLEWDSANADQREAASAHLEGAQLQEAHLEGAFFRNVHLEGADLSRAFLQEAKLRESHLEGAQLQEAHLEGARLVKTQLGGRANFGGEPLPPADLRGVFFDEATSLDSVELGDRDQGFARLTDVRWGGVNLAMAQWSLPHRHLLRWGIWRIDAIQLGDERTAHMRKNRDGKRKDRNTRRTEFVTAVRANRQLATALRAQGLIEDADRFAYKAQTLQRQVLRRQGRWDAFLGSWFLDLIAGYGYRPLRSLLTYLVTIACFAALYWCVTNNVPLTFGTFTHVLTWLGMSAPPPSPEHLQGYEAVVVSVTSFHGRGFFQPLQSPGDKVAILSAIEAAVGLVIEITFIATFTQRFFSR